MSRKIINLSARSLPIAAAALLIHIGTAAAATPQNEFQRQVSAVLAGNIAAHSAPQTHSTRSGSPADAQQSIRQLLLGWSTSHPGRGPSATQSRTRTAADVTRRESPARSDIQSMVQRLLLGERSTARGAS